MLGSTPNSMITPPTKVQDKRLYQSIIRNEILFRRLAEIPGQRIRLSDEILAPYEFLWQHQIEPMSKILSANFSKTAKSRTPGEVISDLRQMIEHSEESFDWLSRATGLGKISKTTPEATTNAVGEQMKHLCYDPSIRSKWEWHSMIAKRRMAHFFRGT